MERHTAGECRAVLERAEELGINILDCWMSEPGVRTNIGNAIAGSREKWYIQGHIGSTWQGGQYTRTRDVGKCKEAFEDLLVRLGTDYIDLGMVHYVDRDWDDATSGPFWDYVQELKAAGTIGCVGLSSHNPEVAQAAVDSGLIDVLMFSVNPCYDLQPASEDVEDLWRDEAYAAPLVNMDPQRQKLYEVCQAKGVGITVMKCYAGGRLFKAETSPFGVALTPVQCLHYALTRPAVCSVMVGYDTPEQVMEAVAYETATAEEKDYATVLAGAPRHAYTGQCTYCGHCKPCPVDIDIAMVNKYYDLATMQPEVPQSVLDHYRQMKVTAKDCIGCHSCESRCPFGVEIAKRMDQAARLFRGQG